MTPAVFFYLKQNASVRSDDHIDDPKAFEDGLKKLFGFGAKVIEKKILEILYEKIDIPQKFGDHFMFAEEVRKAQDLLDLTDSDEPKPEPSNISAVKNWQMTQTS